MTDGSARRRKAAVSVMKAARYSGPPIGSPSRKYTKSSRRQEASYVFFISGACRARKPLTCAHAAIRSRTPLTSVRRRVIEPSRTRQ